jgi:AbrB family looped-hinge helix DNA binding protein
MTIATVTSKGQITIPQDVRDRLKIVAGSRVEFAEGPDGVFDFIPLTGSIMDLQGIVPHNGVVLSIEDIDEAIGAYLAEEDRRSRE